MNKITAVVTPFGGNYTEYLVESLNEQGINALLYEGWGFTIYDHVSRIISLKPDIIHLNWPESLIDRKFIVGREGDIVYKVFQALKKFHAAGIKLVWVMHNLVPHERLNPDFEEALYTLVAGCTDGVIHHSDWGEKQSLAAYGYKGKHRVIRHGYLYKDDCCSLNKAEARKKLGIHENANVFLTVGSIRPYKKLEVLIDAFTKREQKNDVVIIAGRGKEEYVAQVKNRVRDKEKFRFPGRISTEELALSARAADLFVFSYGDESLTSGSPHLSQALLLPQLTQDAPYSREILGDAAFYFDGNKGAGDLYAVLNQINPQDIAEKKEKLETNRKEYTWERTAQQTVQFYQELLS